LKIPVAIMSECIHQGQYRSVWHNNEDVA